MNNSLWLVYERLTNPDGSVEDLVISAHRTLNASREEAERRNLENTEDNLSYVSPIISIPLL